jgi:DNA-binding SARP family transcriptional activator
MEVRVLGPLEVVDGTRRVALPRGRGRALLALLALRAGETVVAERLIDELWGPAPPRTAAKGLHNLVADLRRRLATDEPRDAASSVLATSGSGYVLDVDPDRIDAHRFRRLLDDAVDRPAAERAAGLRAALALWRGPALADLAYEPFAQAEIAVLEELRLTAIEERAEADLALGRHAALVGELEGLVSEHPFRERLRGQLILALYRSGRQADALEVHRTGRQLLVVELGVEPGPELVGLEQAILRHDPTLAVPAASGSPATATHRREVEPWLAAERRTVTVACVDLAEAATAAGDADPELVDRLHTRCAAVAAAVLERHGGTVQGPIGGILVAVFGLPEAHEDDALRAVRAAGELRDAVAATDPEPGPGVTMVARVGISTGEVVVADAAAGTAGASCDVVRFAGRLQQAAGDVTCSWARRAGSCSATPSGSSRSPRWCSIGAADPRPCGGSRGCPGRAGRGPPARRARWSAAAAS